MCHSSRLDLVLFIEFLALLAVLSFWHDWNDFVNSQEGFSAMRNLIMFLMRVRSLLQKMQGSAEECK